MKEIFVRVQGLDSYRIDTHPDFNTRDKIMNNPDAAVEAVTSKLKKTIGYKKGEPYFITIDDSLVAFLFKEAA